MIFQFPGNDDAIRSVQLFCNEMAAAINEGKAILAEETGVEEEVISETETAEVVAEAVAEAEKTETATEAK